MVKAEPGPRAKSPALSLPRDTAADTFLGLLFGGLAACVGNPRDGFNFALADRGRVEDQLRWPGETHRQPSCTHEDPGDSWKCRAGVRKGQLVNSPGLPEFLAPHPPTALLPDGVLTSHKSRIVFLTLGFSQKRVHSLIVDSVLCFSQSILLPKLFPPCGPTAPTPLCFN